MVNLRPLQTCVTGNGISMETCQLSHQIQHAGKLAPAAPAADRASKKPCVPGEGRPDSTSVMDENLRPKNLLLDLASKPLMSWLSCSSFWCFCVQQQHSHLHTVQVSEGVPAGFSLLSGQSCMLQVSNSTMPCVQLSIYLLFARADQDVLLMCGRSGMLPRAVPGQVLLLLDDA